MKPKQTFEMANKHLVQTQLTRFKQGYRVQAPIPLRRSVEGYVWSVYNMTVEPESFWSCDWISIRPTVMGWSQCACACFLILYSILMTDSDLQSHALPVPIPSLNLLFFIIIFFLQVLIAVSHNLDKGDEYRRTTGLLTETNTATWSTHNTNAIGECFCCDNAV